MAVPPVLADLVSAPNAPTRSGRGGRDRRSKFYELSDNLQGAPIRGDAIILRPGARRMLLGDCERLGNAACARSLEPEPIIGKWLRISEGLPSGACWPALVRLTPGGVGFCNRRGAAVWPAPARRLLRLLNCATLLGRDEECRSPGQCDSRARVGSVVAGCWIKPGGGVSVAAIRLPRCTEAVAQTNAPLDFSCACDKVTIFGRTFSAAADPFWAPETLSRGRRNRPLCNSYKGFGLCDSLHQKQQPAITARRGCY